MRKPEELYNELFKIVVACETLQSIVKNPDLPLEELKRIDDIVTQLGIIDVPKVVTNLDKFIPE